MSTEIIEPKPIASMAIALYMHSVNLTDRQFYDLCKDNRDWRLELTASGELIIMPPTGSLTGSRNADLNYQLTAWSKRDGTGITFDSSTGFSLPNGAKRSPDVSWIKLDRWHALTSAQQEGLAPICPDFVVELRSPEDSLSKLQDKMAEYLENGARLGWLIDPRPLRIYTFIVPICRSNVSKIQNQCRATRSCLDSYSTLYHRLQPCGGLSFGPGRGAQTIPARIVQGNRIS